MLADQVDIVIGVDTHRDEHALAIVKAATGRLLGELNVPSTQAGYAQALEHAAALGLSRAWALEASGGYGAGLARHLAGAGERVIEVDRPCRRGERTAAKSDALDAARAARTALGRARLAAPRRGAVREALRVLMVARAGAVRTRTDAIRQIRALVVSAPEDLRRRLRALSAMSLLVRCARLRPGPGADPAVAATATALRALARRALAATDEARGHERDIARYVRALAPQLLSELGVGPVSAAQILISWSHAGRFADEGRFARLAGVAPIPASSGQRVRHRLDRGGDRQLNRALHTIVLCRCQRHEPTRAYIARRISEGKSRREAMRCLKRYLARHLFRLLEHVQAT